MKKDVSLYLPCEKFIVKKLLSHGSYGIVYLAYSHIQHQTVAVKVEKIPNGYNLNQSNLQREIQNLQALAGIEGIPQILDYDYENNQYSYFSMEMLGKDFSQLLKNAIICFPHKTVLMIAFQVITILKQIHERDYIHRDIKPENLVLGRGLNRNKIYMIDFGTAKSFVEKTTKKHIQFQEKQPFVGTYRYASKAPHFGFEQGRKDDLESLGYVLIYFCKGRLPWQDLRQFNQSMTSQQKVIGQMKSDILVNELCEGLPSFFHWYMHFVNALKFEEKPNYDLIIKMINNCLSEEFKTQNDNDFDWSAFSINQSYVCLSNQDAISMYSPINNNNSTNRNINQLNIYGLQGGNQSGQSNHHNQYYNNININHARYSEKGLLHLNQYGSVFQQNYLNENGQKLKTFNKSKSVGIQNTQVESFEENYSRKVHCEDFDINDSNDGEEEDNFDSKGLVKQLPYLFQSHTRRKQ